METNFLIALGIIIPIVIVSMVLATAVVNEDNKLIFVYPKTGHEYKLLLNCRMKCPVTGEWYDAVIYKGLDDGKYYVREKGDFYGKFIKLKYWKDGTKDR